MSEQEILPGLARRTPSKVKLECASKKSFSGDALSERDWDRVPMNAVSLKPCALHKVMASTTDATFIRSANTVERY
jgi:hypothetical protein